jgi:lysozyme
MMDFLSKLKNLVAPKPATAKEPAKPVASPAPTMAQPSQPSQGKKPVRRQINQKGLALIKGFEGLELSAYPDPASPLGKACTATKLSMRNYRKISNWQSMSGEPWTIGFGHTGVMPDGQKVGPDHKIDGVVADFLLREDLAATENGVSKMVTAQTTDNQFAALVSFAFNCGLGNLQKSTLLKLVNAGDFAAAANEFIKWNKAQGKELPGLTKRRNAEKDLFIS